MDGETQEVIVFSESNNDLKIYNPWGNRTRVKLTIGDSEKIMSGDIINVNLIEGQTVVIEKYM